MKKKIHLSLNEIVFACIGCNHEYQTLSTLKENVRIDSCSNCNPSYTGLSASKLKVGKVEKFLRREEIARSKMNKK
jgi:large subunit ribosomal protein L31